MKKLMVAAFSLTALPLFCYAFELSLIKGID
jgi:hypothetical protein